MKKKKIQERTNYRVIWDGTTWMVDTLPQCRKEAQRLRQLYPLDYIAIEETRTIISLTEY